MTIALLVPLAIGTAANAAPIAPWALFHDDDSGSGGDDDDDSGSAHDDDDDSGSAHDDDDDSGSAHDDDDDSGSAHDDDDSGHHDPTTPYCFADMGDCPCNNNYSNGGCVNGSGDGAFITGSGSTSVAEDDLILTVHNLPPLTFGQFLMAKDVTRIPMLNSGGLLCIAAAPGGKIFRLMPGQVNAAGRFREGPGIVALAAAVNSPVGQIEAGDTWYFQFWFRDMGGPCGAASGTSNAVAVVFTP